MYLKLDPSILTISILELFCKDIFQGVISEYLNVVALYVRNDHPVIVAVEVRAHVIKRSVPSHVSELVTFPIENLCAAQLYPRKNPVPVL